MWNCTLGNKTCNPYFSVTVDLLNKSRERCPPFKYSARLRSCIFSKRSNAAKKFRTARYPVSCICILYPVSQPYTFHIHLKVLISMQFTSKIFNKFSGKRSDRTKKKKHNSIHTIAIPLPMCFTFFVLLRRFLEKSHKNINEYTSFFIRK